MTKKDLINLIYKNKKFIMEINGRKCVKNGKTKEGHQKYKDKITGKTFVEVNHLPSKTFKMFCIYLYIKGLSFRKISKMFDISHVSIYNWLNIYSDEIINRFNVSSVTQITDIEVDEMFTYLDKKKEKFTF
jgi:hypothetical protein